MEQTTIKLTQEELLFALRVIGEASILGMGGAGLAEADVATLSILTEAGARALMSRDLLVSGDQGQLVLDRSVYAVILACAHPDQMVSLVVTQANQAPHQVFFYRAPELAVIHTPLADGIHHFEIAEDSDMGIANVRRILDSLPEIDGLAITRTLAEAPLATAAELAPADIDAAIRQLEPAGMTAMEARDFAIALAQPICIILLQLVYRFQPSVEQVVLKLVASPAGHWLAHSNQVAADQVIVQRMSLTKVHQTLLQYFQHFSVRPATR
ncbi:MAG: hypothetical protein ABIV47_03875 [Roseiflexaceae bacterium]